MLKCCETIFACFEGILFIGIDEENNIQNKYPFSENNTKNEIKYDCSDSDSSEAADKQKEMLFASSTDDEGGDDDLLKSDDDDSQQQQQVLLIEDDNNKKSKNDDGRAPQQGWSKLVLAPKLLLCLLIVSEGKYVISYHVTDTACGVVLFTRCTHAVQREIADVARDFLDLDYFPSLPSPPHFSQLLLFYNTFS